MTSGGSTSYYCYGPVGRLASAGATSSSCATTAPWGNSSAPYQYAYDKNGNLTSKTINGTTTGYTVNDANELTNTGYSYDANGNQTAAPSSASYTALGYNERDQTDSITPSGGSAQTASYFGRGQTDRTNFNSQSFLNDLLGTGRRTAGSTSTDYTRTPGGTVYSENVGGSHYYFAFDGLGSVVGLFNSNGAYLQDGGSNYTAVYEPYGKLTNPPSGSYPAFDYRYAGYWFDTSTGLYKVGARYYDPNTSRWTQRDPIDNPLDLSGWNRYSYAGDDPINNTDPSGMCWTGLCWVKHTAHAVSHWWHHRAKYLGAAIYESLDAIGLAGAGIAIGYGCSFAIAGGPIGVAAVALPCVVAIGGAGLGAYYEGRDAVHNWRRAF